MTEEKRVHSVNLLVIEMYETAIIICSPQFDEQGLNNHVVFLKTIIKELEEKIGNRSLTDQIKDIP